MFAFVEQVCLVSTNKHLLLLNNVIFKYFQDCILLICDSNTWYSSLDTQHKKWIKNSSKLQTTHKLNETKNQVITENNRSDSAFSSRMFGLFPCLSPKVAIKLSINAKVVVAEHDSRAGASNWDGQWPNIPDMVIRFSSNAKNTRRTACIINWLNKSRRYVPFLALKLFRGLFYEMHGGVLYVIIVHHQ